MTRESTVSPDAGVHTEQQNWTQDAEDAPGYLTTSLFSHLHHYPPHVGPKTVAQGQGLQQSRLTCIPCP